MGNHVPLSWAGKSRCPESRGRGLGREGAGRGGAPPRDSQRGGCTEERRGPETRTGAVLEGLVPGPPPGLGGGRGMQHRTLSSAPGLWASIPCPRSELDLDLVLSSGQSFSWREQSPGHWTGVLDGRLWTLTQADGRLHYTVYGEPAGPGAPRTLRRFFQLHVRLADLYRRWASADPHFRDVAPRFPGVRLLRQEPVECLFSFICSSNNHLSRITGMVQRLRALLGPRLGQLDGVCYHGFPSVQALAREPGPQPGRPSPHPRPAPAGHPVPAGPSLPSPPPGPHRTPSPSRAVPPHTPAWPPAGPRSCHRPAPTGHPVPAGPSLPSPPPGPHRTPSPSWARPSPGPCHPVPAGPVPPLTPAQPPRGTQSQLGPSLPRALPPGPHGASSPSRARPSPHPRPAPTGHPVPAGPVPPHTPAQPPQGTQSQPGPPLPRALPPSPSRACPSPHPHPAPAGHPVPPGPVPPHTPAWPPAGPRSCHRPAPTGHPVPAGPAPPPGPAAQSQLGRPSPHPRPAPAGHPVPAGPIPPPGPATQSQPGLSLPSPPPGPRRTPSPSRAHSSPGPCHPVPAGPSLPSPPPGPRRTPSPSRAVPPLTPARPPQDTQSQPGRPSPHPRPAPAGHPVPAGPSLPSPPPGPRRTPSPSRARSSPGPCRPAPSGPGSRAPAGQGGSHSGGLRALAGGGADAPPPLPAEAEVEPRLRELGFGYRARFVRESARAILDQRGGPGWLQQLRSAPYEEARRSLCALPGVGTKVADCVCLMALDKPQAVPVDVHVWQIARRDYGWQPASEGRRGLSPKAGTELGDFFRSLWGPYAGWTQAVLFCADLRQTPKPQILQEKAKPRKRKKGTSESPASGQEAAGKPG